MKYLECLRTVFGGGAAPPPDDAAATLARGAKRLRAVIETETRAGQTLAASWAGAFGVKGHASVSHFSHPASIPLCVCTRGACLFDVSKWLSQPRQISY